MPKNLVFFSSSGPGNFRTAVEFCSGNAAVRLVHLITDRPGIPSLELAAQHGIPSSVEPIRGSLDLADKASVSRRVDELRRTYGRLCAIEDASGPIDLIVLAFRRVLIGPILERFGSRTINVHPSDLSVHNVEDRKRRYTGIGGLARSIMDGNRETRTSIHRVDSGIDTGELLCLGPFVTFKGDRFRPVDINRHERHQKDVSDKVALRHVLERWLHGDLGVCSILS